MSVDYELGDEALRMAGAGSGAVLAGLYDGMPDVDYHAHPALSYSGAKLLMPPGTPALFHYQREHGRPPNREFDFGHAAHGEVLGTGPELAVVKAADWRTKAAQQQRDEARARGAVPILIGDHEQVVAMATALRRHRLAAAVFDPQRGGRAEQSLFWTDDRTGVNLRARMDWLSLPLPSGRLVLADYKSCAAADTDSVRRAAWNYRYHWQDAWYCDGARALGLADDVVFAFVFQEKHPPYLVHGVQLDADWQRIGRAYNEQAIERFRDCTDAGIWPGYGADDDFTLISPPGWVRE